MKHASQRLAAPFASAATIALVVAIVVGTPARGALVVNAPIDVIGNLSASDFSNNGYGTNSYKDWGNEPSVAFDPANTNDLLVSSFAYGSSSTTGADVFSSSNAGTNWTSQFTITQPSSTVAIPNDRRFVFDGAGTLHGAVLGGCTANGNTCNVYAGSSANPTGSGFAWSGSGAAINTAASAGFTDQPWLAVSSSDPKQVFVAYDDFHSNTGERVAASADGGKTFPVDNPITTSPQSSSVNPGTRIATDGVGNVYSIIGVGSTTATAGVNNVTYSLNQSKDGGKTWLFDTASTPNGIKIASASRPSFAIPARRPRTIGSPASTTCAASHRHLRRQRRLAHLRDLWRAGRQRGQRIYLEEFHPSGATLVGSTPVVVSPAGQNAALPSLTVLADGSVVVEYETYNGTQVQVHVTDSVDHGSTIASNVVEYGFTPLTLAQATGSTTSNREFGDYVHVASVNNTFYGTFAGLGNINSGGINTTGLIDPFVFTGSDTPGPDCSSECTNTFNGQSSGAPARSFSYVLKGDVRGQIDTALTANDPLVDAFAYVNQKILKDPSALSTVGLSLDANGNTVITYTGSHPILSTYGFSYGAGNGDPHFGFEGTPGAPLVNISQFWTYGEEVTQQLANLSAACPAVTGADLHYAVFFADVAILSESDGGQWTECAFPIGTNPQFLLTNSTLFDEQLSNVGFLLSDTMIPLDFLNLGMTPPPGQPGSAFTDLPQFDGLILAPGASFEVDVPEPSALALLCVGLLGLFVVRPRARTA